MREEAFWLRCPHVFLGQIAAAIGNKFIRHQEFAGVEFDLVKILFEIEIGDARPVFMGDDYFVAPFVNDDADARCITNGLANKGLVFPIDRKVESTKRLVLFADPLVFVHRGDLAEELSRTRGLRRGNQTEQERDQQAMTG